MDPLEMAPLRLVSRAVVYWARLKGVMPQLAEDKGSQPDPYAAVTKKANPVRLCLKDAPGYS